MITTGYVLTALIALGILFIGSRFYWAPAAAARDFGIPDPAPMSPALRSWLSVKGTRDMVSGCFLVLLMAQGSARLLGEFLLVASLIAIGDAVTVMRSGGRTSVALGIHGATALVIVIAGGLLIGGTP